MMRYIFLLLLPALFLLQACKDDDNTCTKEVPASALADVDQTRLQADIQAIDEYIAANGITNVQTQPNGMRYVITQQGDGNTPCLESFVQAKYTGKLLKTGTVFAPEQSATFKLNGLIIGWQLVLPTIKAGSKVTLYVPSGYGYGPDGGASGKIPSNANLIFDIEVISIL